MRKQDNIQTNLDLIAKEDGEHSSLCNKLRFFINKMVKLKPQDRYQSAEVAFRELEQIEQQFLRQEHNKKQNDISNGASMASSGGVRLMSPENQVRTPPSKSAIKKQKRFYG